MLNLALCQIDVNKDKAITFASIRRAIAEAVTTPHNATLIMLPECLNSPYNINNFAQFAEPVPALGDDVDPISSPSLALFSELAKDHGVYLIAGTIIEYDEGKLFNTCTVWSPNGTLIAIHRKTHLFSVSIPATDTVPAMNFHEEEVLSPGEDITTFHIPGFGSVGLGICFAMRFHKLATATCAAADDVKLLAYPAAFSTTTLAYFHPIQRGRAIDHQVFVAACSPARDETEGVYHACAESSIFAPNGQLIAKAGIKSEVVSATLNLAEIAKENACIPLLDRDEAFYS